MKSFYQILKEAALAYNNVPELKDFKISKIVGVHQKDLLEQFLTKIEKLADKAPELDIFIPDYTAIVYNAIVEENVDSLNELLGSINLPTKAEKAKLTAQPTGPVWEKSVKARKDSVKRSRYGFYTNTIAEQLDNCMWEGATVEEMLKELGIKRYQIMRHVKKLRAKGLTVNEIPGRVLADHFFKVEEEFL